MLFTELLRVTVLAIAAVATGLAAATVVAVEPSDPTAVLIFTAAWWTIATVAGLVFGARDQSGPGSALAGLLSSARTQPMLPDATSTGIIVRRLWPLAVFLIVVGVATFRFPQVGAIGAGFALLWALLWRRHESAVAAIEDRDAVRFYVEPDHAWRPLRLVRTPGMGSDRPLLRGKPPDPPPAA